MPSNGGSGEDSITTKNTDYSFISLRNPIPFQQTQAQVSYFPPPNFSNPKWNPLSIVDALKSINENPSLSHRSIIGQKNGIPGKVGTADYNIRMLSLLKSGRLIRP